MPLAVSAAEKTAVDGQKTEQSAPAKQDDPKASAFEKQDDAGKAGAVEKKDDAAKAGTAEKKDDAAKAPAKQDAPAQSGAAKGAAGGGLDRFVLGMSQKDAEQAGASASGDSGTMQASVSWLNTDWEAVLMLGPSGLATYALQADSSDPIIAGVRAEFKKRAFRVAHIVVSGKDEVKLYEQAAQGKDEAAIEKAFEASLKEFIDTGKGTCVVVFIPSAIFDDVVAIEQKNSDSDEVVKKYGDKMVYAFQLDKDTGKIAVVVSTLLTITQ